jgi:tetratricopeptide (TPR) repeat protein
VHLKVVTAFLADHAHADPDGKIDAMGAGLDSVTFPFYPALLPQVALALKLSVSRAEQAAEHAIQVRYVDAADELLLPLFGFTLGPSVITAQSPEYATIPLVYTMRSLPLPRPGTYSVKVDLDGVLIASMDVTATVGQPRRGIGEPINTLSNALNAGFRTYVGGDVATAAAIFRDLARRFPASADVHNNLGFTLLAQGRPQEALDSFRRAEAGKYPSAELLQANMAACLYLLGDFAEAQKVFTGLLTARLHAAPVLLFGLGRTQLHSLILNSAADYIALMALNGSRCAVAHGQTDSARQLYEIARSGLITFTGPPENSDTFKSTLLELEEDISKPAKA